MRLVLLVGLEFSLVACTTTEMPDGAALSGVDRLV
jgi:hypothetical protein